MSASDSKEVVVGLPFVGTRVLMQLRDFNPKISFPGHWGFFGGALHVGETAEQAVRREIAEEIGFHPGDLIDLGGQKITDLNDLMSYAYCFPLTVSLEKLRLTEGADFALFDIAEVRSGKMFSPKFKRKFPVAHTFYIPAMIEKMLAKIA